MNDWGPLLILDDDDAIRESFTYYFEDQGWKVWSVSNAEEALRELESRSPTCGIIDIRLPGINGEEFIEKAHKILEDMLFIICTGSPEYEEQYHPLTLDCLHPRIFHKPVAEMTRLEEELIQFLEKKEASL